MTFKLETWQGIAVALFVYLAVGYTNQFATENTVSYVMDIATIV